MTQPKIEVLWQSSELQLRADERGEGQWMTVFEYICEKYKDNPEKILPTIEKLVDDYCTVFWRIQNPGNKTLTKASPLH